MPEPTDSTKPYLCIHTHEPGPATWENEADSQVEGTLSDPVSQFKKIRKGCSSRYKI